MTANQLTKEDLDDLMDKNRISINNKLPKYMQITAMEIFDAEFEKTPKKSIKRYLYK
jgi:long-chain acyl-CoA synthetase